MAISLLLDIPPELLELISEHLPLHATASTLASLAMTNRQLYAHVHPLLYRNLYLMDERLDRAFDILYRLSEPAQSLGEQVRGLYLRCRTYSPSIHEEPIVTSITLLKGLVMNGRLPLLQRLELVFADGGDTKDAFVPTKAGDHGTHDVDLGPWDLIKDGCPSLHTFTILYGDGKPSTDFKLSEQIICESSFWSIKNLSSLTLDFIRHNASYPWEKELAARVAIIAPRLEHLDLTINGDIQPFLNITFHQLLSLAFRQYSGIPCMGFWRKHGRLERLILSDPTEPLSVSLEDGLLPNLAFLAVESEDFICFSRMERIRSLVLTWSLSHSHHLPTGLIWPSLRSLEMRDPERDRTLMQRIINGAPQLEELFVFTEHQWSLSTQLKAFKHLQTLVPSHPRLQRLVVDLPPEQGNYGLDPSLSAQLEPEVLSIAQDKFPSLVLVECWNHIAKLFFLFHVKRGGEGAAIAVEHWTKLGGWISPGLENFVPRM